MIDVLEDQKIEKRDTLLLLEEKFEKSEKWKWKLKFVKNITMFALKNCDQLPRERG